MPFRVHRWPTVHVATQVQAVPLVLQQYGRLGRMHGMALSQGLFPALEPHGVWAMAPSAMSEMITGVVHPTTRPRRMNSRRSIDLT